MCKEDEMIHFTKEGAYKRIGLNIYRSRGGFVIGWVWYDVKTRELHGWRFRFRLHMKPCFIFERNRQSVIDTFMKSNDLVAVQRSLLEDEAPYIAKLMKYYDLKAELDRLERAKQV